MLRKGDDSMAEIVITKENFEKEVISSPKAVLVDFWAEWCGPCSMLSPVISEIADEMEDTVTVGKVNVDEQPELAATFGIDSIPSLIVFKNGKITASSVGYIPKESVIELIEKT